jgi:hypothetical protein
MEDLSRREKLHEAVSRGEIVDDWETRHEP